MSFNKETKNELTRELSVRKCCMLSEIAGFIRICGRIGLAGGGKFKIVMPTENPVIARYFKMIIKQYFSVEAFIEVDEAINFNRGKTYLVTIRPEDRSEEILRETGILMIREGMNFISDGIYKDLIKKKCCKKSYLRGLFLGAGSITDPEKNYHFELSTTSKALAHDIMKLLSSFTDIFPKISQRKKEYIVYIKDSNQIVDLIAIMGASNTLFQYEDIRIKKGIKNRANRINNCDQANIDKSIVASHKQIESINKIKSKVGLDKLPLKLKEIAIARLENPDYTLAELGEILNPPIKKSGVNKRLSKIEDFANKI